MISDHPKNPVSLRISVTDRCSSRCVYCTPSEGIQLRDKSNILTFEQIVSFVHLMKSHFGLSKVHLTGGEPLVRPGIAELVAMLTDIGLEDLALTTNAQDLGTFTRALKKAGLNRINVSLDSLNEKIYSVLTRGRQLKRTLDGIRLAIQEGFSPLKLNTVVLNGFNSSEVIEMV